MRQNNNLRFRRQFLVTYEPLKTFANWQHIQYKDMSFHIYAHPDLEMSVAYNNKKNIVLTLLGFALDPEYPNKSNKEITNELANSTETVEGFSKLVTKLAGRFVFILSLSNNIYIYHDACGFRTVYYACYNSKTYISSQPLLFSELFNLKPSEHYYTFNKSFHRLFDIEYWLPSGITLYENIYHLMPNHYLDVTRTKQIRYWPTHPITEQGFDKSVKLAADMLEKLMLSANSRFDLALSLTSGWDSRTLLAASKKIVDDLYIYTLQYRDLTKNSSDIKIPISMLNEMEVKHHLLDCRCGMDKEFYKLYKKNVDLAHDDWAKIAFGMFNQYPQDRIAIKGLCSEIARCYNYKDGQHDDICYPEQLGASVPGWNELPFIVEQLGVWLKNAKKICISTNMDILDLFHWEHRMGSWQAQSQLEWDIVQEVFNPFNYRPLLEIMLGTPIKYRKEKDALLIKGIINHSWPALLKWPINPLNKMDIFRNWYRKLLKGMGIYKQALQVLDQYHTVKQFLRKMKYR